MVRAKVTPDGRQICFSFANGRPCAGTCGRVHCCQYPGCHCNKSNKDCPKCLAEKW